MSLHHSSLLMLAEDKVQCTTLTTALLSEEPPGLIAIKSDTSTAIPRINMSWQSFISNKICVEKKDSVNVSVREKIV